jgi:lysyl-tRNA synthetase class 2
MYLRIAPELNLKKLVIGGANRVYEIGPQFRNESADNTHNPEFTSLEFYMAYSDYNKLFSICEDMICSIVNRVTGTNKINWTATDGTVTEILFDPQFPRLDIMTELAKVDIVLDLNDPDLRNKLDDICSTRKIPCGEPRTVNRLLDKLIDKYVESQCMQPTFVINHPKCMSPLSKACKNNNTLSERFELFVCKMELCNAYSELNDPDEQYKMFAMQQADKNNGDEESQSMDTSYIDALHYGLPCTAGFGCGLDRLIMLLLGKNSIRDVIAFPVLRNE